MERLVEDIKKSPHYDRMNLEKKISFRKIKNSASVYANIARKDPKDPKMISIKVHLPTLIERNEHFLWLESQNEYIRKLSSNPLLA